MLLYHKPCPKCGGKVEILRLVESKQSIRACVECGRKRKMPNRTSELQAWTTRRNGLRFHIKGLQGNLNRLIYETKFMSIEEALELSVAISKVSWVLQNWKAQTEELKTKLNLKPKEKKQHGVKETCSIS